MARVREINVKSVLIKTQLPGVEYCINPYIGCTHSCVYCYARFMRRFSGHEGQKWGDFVDIKINSPEILEKEIKKSPKGTVLLSSVTDPYQPIEARCQLTRRILEILVKYQWPISILTKFNLILRDLDILKQFRDIDVGFSITTLDEKIHKLIEPGIKDADYSIYSFGSRYNHTTDLTLCQVYGMVKRILTILSSLKIKTYVFIAPTIPYVTDYEEIFADFGRIVDFIMIDKFNPKGENWLNTEKVLKEHFPEMVDKIKKAIFNPKYWFSKKQEALALSKKYQIPLKLCF